MISDKDLVPRLEPMLQELIPHIQEGILKIHIKNYFAFLIDFVKSYHSALEDHVFEIIKALVRRILSELKACHEKGEKNNIIINKCWNVIRMVCELDSFMPRYAMQIEDLLKPLYEYMSDPTSIEFEDDIILTLKSCIKKTNNVS